MEFLLDENVHWGLFSFLKESGHDVKSSPKGIRNSKLFELALEERRVLITRDSDFLDKSLYPASKHFGIILLRVSAEDLELQKKAISRFLEKVKELRGKVVVLFSDKRVKIL